MTWCCKKAQEPDAHPSGLTGSRCLASEASCWLVFMFLCTFLFTSSTCLPCCGHLCAGCLYSWSWEPWLGCKRLKRESLWWVSLAPVLVNSWQLEIVPLSRWLNKTLVEMIEGLLGLDVLSNSSLHARCGYRSPSLGWKALSTSLAPGPNCG